MENKERIKERLGAMEEFVRWAQQELSLDGPPEPEAEKGEAEGKIGRESNETGTHQVQSKRMRMSTQEPSQVMPDRRQARNTGEEASQCIPLPLRLSHSLHLCVMNHGHPLPHHDWESAESDQLSLVAGRKLSSATVLAKIRGDCLLTWRSSETFYRFLQSGSWRKRTLQGKGLGNEGSKAADWPAECLAAGAVFSEIKRGKESKWAAYLASLPSAASLRTVPVLWCPTEVRKLAWTSVYIRLRLLRVEEFLDKIIVPLAHYSLSKNAEQIDNKQIREDFLRAVALVLSRGFELEDEEIAMVPIADLLDHSDQQANVQISFDSPEAEEKSAVEGPDEESSDLYLSTCQDVSQGDPLRSTYGLLGNSCLLFKYGFMRQKASLYSTVIIPSFLLLIALAIQRPKEDDTSEAEKSEEMARRLEFLRDHGVFRCQEAVWRKTKEFTIRKMSNQIKSHFMEIVPSLFDCYESWEDLFDESFTLSFEPSKQTRPSRVNANLPGSVSASEALRETLAVLSMTASQLAAYESESGCGTSFEDAFPKRNAGMSDPSEAHSLPVEDHLIRFNRGINTLMRQVIGLRLQMLEHEDQLAPCGPECKCHREKAVIHMAQRMWSEERQMLQHYQAEDIGQPLMAMNDGSVA